MSIKLMMPSHPLWYLSPLAFNLSNIGVFSYESVLCIRWPKYWSLSFSINLCNEYSGLISFRIDWFDLLAVQGTLKSLLQHHSSKASVLWSSAFFTVQLSHDYWKNNSFDYTHILLNLNQSHITISKLNPTFVLFSFPKTKLVSESWGLGMNSN